MKDAADMCCDVITGFIFPLHDVGSRSSGPALRIKRTGGRMFEKSMADGRCNDAHLQSWDGSNTQNITGPVILS